MMDWLNTYTQTAEFWAILGAVLICLEIFDGHGIAVSFGISAFIMSGMIFLTELYQIHIVPSWPFALLEYAIISLVLAHFVRKLRIFRGDTPDINDY